MTYFYIIGSVVDIFDIMRSVVNIFDIIKSVIYSGICELIYGVTIAVGMVAQ